MIALDSDLGSGALYKRVWLVAIAVGVSGAPFVFFFRDSAPWVVVIPIVLGSGSILAIEFFQSYDRRRSTISRLPKGFSGLRNINDKIIIEIRQPSKTGRQLTLFGDVVEEKNPRQKIRVLHDEQGSEVAAITCDRFVELLTNDLIKSSDKAAEHAIAMALKRFGDAAGESSEFKMFMDKTILEIIKSDFRGNILTIVAKSGEKILLQVAKEAKKQVEPQNEGVTSQAFIK